MAGCFFILQLVFDVLRLQGQFFDAEEFQHESTRLQICPHQKEIGPQLVPMDLNMGFKGFGFASGP